MNYVRLILKLRSDLEYLINRTPPADANGNTLQSSFQTIGSSHSRTAAKGKTGGKSMFARLEGNPLFFFFPFFVFLEQQKKNGGKT